ncbi:MAG: YegS/Rv2252/BmrU family lipid kinase [Bacteroidia bacterium]|nr:YegS/Rv2252/BmrU family lipid kinase [Bacteroidia bacterium]
MSKGFLLVANPYSGQKNGEKTAQHILQWLNTNGFKAELFISESILHLKEFIKDCELNTYHGIGIIGGDGSMHEFLNAALEQNPALLPPVALFPCGTGNAFNFDIGCSTIEETLNCITKNTSSFIDIAEVNFPDKRLWSFNILGCGLVAEINQLAEKMRFLGGARYNVASVIKLLANPKTTISIETDEGLKEGVYSFVLACNTRYTGKGMMMAPNARLNDGKFDVLMVEACSVWKLLKLFPKIFKGTHIGADVLTYIQTSKLKVTTSSQNITNIDGEMKGSTPFSMTVHTNKVKVFLK